jgi:hypothetical protein
MQIELPSIPDAQRTPLMEALLAILDQQQQHIQQLEHTVGKLRDEIAILKGQMPRPKIAPSRLEAPPPKPPSRSGRQAPWLRQTPEEPRFRRPRRSQDSLP